MTRIKVLALLASSALVAGLVAGTAGGHTGCTQTGDVFEGDIHDNDCNGDGSGNTMYGYQGNDTFSGFAGADYLLGQTGNDNLFGNDGPDTLYGASGDDDLKGAAAGDDFYDNQDAGDRDRVCDGDGSDRIFLDDGDGQDIWYETSDGQAENQIELDGMDSRTSAACPF